MKITKTVTIEKSTRHANYTNEERLAAIELAQEIGVKAAAEKLGIDCKQNIYIWKSQLKAKAKREMEIETMRNKIEAQDREIARLKAALAAKPSRPVLKLPFIKEETVVLG